MGTDDVPIIEKLVAIDLSAHAFAHFEKIMNQCPIIGDIVHEFFDLTHRLLLRSGGRIVGLSTCRFAGRTCGLACGCGILIGFRCGGIIGFPL